MRSGKKTVAILNKSSYGGSYENGDLYVSLVRGTTYCAHPVLDREIIPSDKFTQKTDQGERDYSYRLTVCDECELERKANEFNRKPYAVNVFPTGAYRKEKTFSLEISDKNITLVTLKKSEEKEGFVLRLLNNFPSEAETDIEICGNVTHAKFGKYEAKTYLFNGETLTEEQEMII